MSDEAAGQAVSNPRRSARQRLYIAARNRARNRRFNLILPVAAVMVPLLILSVGAWSVWRATWREAQAELRFAAEAAAEYADRTLTSYGVAAGRINDRLLGLSDAEIRDREAQIHAQLQSLVSELRQGALTYVIDSEGRPLASSDLFPVPRDASLADREFFRVLSAPDAPELHVSGIFVGRFDQRVLFGFSRIRRDAGAVTGTPGRFLGLTTISLDPRVMADALRRFLPAPSDHLRLVRHDGVVITQTSGLDPPIPVVSSDSPFHAVSRTRGQGAVFVDDAANEAALVALQRLSGLPVYAVASRARSAIVAEWRATVAGHLIFGIPATLALLLLSLSVRRSQLLLSEAGVRLEADVKRGEDRLRRAQRYALVGAFEVDLLSGRSRRSAEYMALHGTVSRSAQETHLDWVRRLHPEDRERAEAALVDAIADGTGTTDYAQTYRTVTDKGEVRWIAARGEIERDARGRAVTLRGVHVDVTSLRTAEIALATTDTRLRLSQEAIGIGNWEWPPTQRRLRLSAKSVELLGFGAADGVPSIRSVLRRVMASDRKKVARAVSDAISGGQVRIEVRISIPTEGSQVRSAWLMVRGSALDLQDRQGKRVLGIAYDVTERKAAEEYAAILAHEVEHRAQNLLAIVLGLVRVTPADDTNSLRESLERRIGSMSRTLTLLGQTRRRTATLRQLVELELEAFRPLDPNAAPRFILSGPDVALLADAAESVSLVLHELSTNASKYGALSAPQGLVEVTWSIANGVVTMVWRETGGPAIAGAPERMGFGSQLIRMAFEHRLGGSYTKHWNPEGLVCEATFPIPQA